MKRIFLFYISCSLLFLSCTSGLDVFEKDVPIPGHQWDSGFKPEISFTITDTLSLYNIYLVIRHTDAYNFNNIWIRATVQQPGDKSAKSRQYDLPLATNEKGWLGSAMDDIYEQRVLIQPQTKFRKQGEYLFTIEEVMREDPLKAVMNAGIRIEKLR